MRSRRVYTGRSQRAGSLEVGRCQLLPPGGSGFPCPCNPKSLFGLVLRGKSHLQVVPTQYAEALKHCSVHEPAQRGATRKVSIRVTPSALSSNLLYTALYCSILLCPTRDTPCLHSANLRAELCTSDVLPTRKKTTLAQSVGEAHRSRRGTLHGHCDGLATPD